MKKNPLPLRCILITVLATAPLAVFAQDDGASLVRKITVTGDAFQAYEEMPVTGLKLNLQGADQEAVLQTAKEELGPEIKELFPEAQEPEMRWLPKKATDDAVNKAEVVFPIAFSADELETAKGHLTTLQKKLEDKDYAKSAQLVFGKSDEEHRTEIHLQALEEALRIAKSKAERLARVYNMAVTDPIEITENTVEQRNGGASAQVVVTFEMR